MNVDLARVICRFDDLADPGARGFTLGSGPWPLRGFVVRKGDYAYGFLNRCPHAGHPLNWKPDQFFAPAHFPDRSILMCASHGALFEPTTGFCVAGPCVGTHLQALPVGIRDGYVILEEDPDRLAARFA